MALVNYLIDEIDDPFNIFPLEAVSEHLKDVISETYKNIAFRSGPWGVAEKFQTVEDEHDYQKINLLIGTMFVLGQAAITQTISIISKIREITEIEFPIKKVDILYFQSDVNKDIGISKIAIIDATANFFKHHHEWPMDWIGSKGTQQYTINIVQKIGLYPEGKHNLETALSALGGSSNRTSEMGFIIQKWREKIAEHIRKQIF